jgi:hypothetical protein
VDRSRAEKGPEWEANEDVRLNPDSIANVSSTRSLDACCSFFFQSYWYLTSQDRSSWTWELDREFAFVNEE